MFINYSGLFSCYCDKHHDQKQAREGRAYWAYISIFTVHHWGDPGRDTSQNWRRDHRGMLFTGSLASSFSASFLTQLRITYLGSGTAPSGLSPPVSITNHHSHLQNYPQSSLLVAILPASIFSGDSSLIKNIQDTTQARLRSLRRHGQLCPLGNALMLCLWFNLTITFPAPHPPPLYTLGCVHLQIVQLRGTRGKLFRMWIWGHRLNPTPFQIPFPSGNLSEEARFFPGSH